jgi:NAD(P)-dependent dehydrogenase (short-subunit alcohol dehydrogenase family)
MTALITGCSTGIGRATALRLHRAGMTVYATARKLDSVADLEDVGLRTLRLDVTDHSSMVQAVARVEAECGAVDVLVNNAGYGLSGTFEETSSEAIREQFETNVFGPVQLTRLVLPGMRRKGAGSIVNLSSIFGKYAVPGGGYYHATKHSIEALSDALRVEVSSFGIRVMVVQPGPVLTEFGVPYVAGMDTTVSGWLPGPKHAGDAPVAARPDVRQIRGAQAVSGAGADR